MSNKITITDNTTKVVTIAAQGPKGDKGAFSPDENQTINFSGSKYSGSMLISMTTTGSIIPEGNGNWDIGSEKNPFRDLYITTESLKFVSKGTGRVVSSLSAQNVEDLKVGKTINPTIKTLRKTDGTTETKTRFIEAQAFVSSLDNDVYIKTGTDRIDFVAGGTGGSGVVIIRYPADAIPLVTVSPGTNTKNTVPAGCGYARFTVTGCFAVGSG